MSHTASALGDSMTVRPLLSDGSLGAAVKVAPVRFERTQSVVDDAHRSADAGSGVVFVDAVNSVGAFEVPAGSRASVGGGPSMLVVKVERFDGLRGRAHHWELTLR